ncbi:cellulose binding domain-containing protein [Dactylosporangium matsuzakiense]|uniref:cellulose binding domain-containing protein n=1 Tax=Dactylosporangium matsuzakiense TaxID=53360 RepID=UPI0021C313F5|nr:cellulose binding domain-containing protein [Dactylosporangium matsuzakiense]UWZ43528.1 cellulose binding domain-containing protein [Dactylosporangium matsuzakiense]
MNQLLVALVVAALGVPAADGAATATFVKQSEWSTGYTGQFDLSNGTASPWTWKVEFDLPVGTSVGNFWGATVTRSGDHYVATGAAWNATVAPGGATNFGWVSLGTGSPQNVSVNGGGTSNGPDIRPPSTPQNLRSVVGTSTFTLRWDAASDDTAVKSYEVYSGANLIATVSGTEYTMGMPPPMIYTYRVRALDAAGNASPYAVITPGGQPDTTAPTAPDSVYPGSTKIMWTAATDNVAVAGYDVYINSDHYGATSALSLNVPPIGFGSFSFTVIAFDGAGNRSAPRTVRVAVDPGPASDWSSPTPPANLRVTVTGSTATWTWSASSDNVKVAGYQVFHGNDWVGNVTGTSFTEPLPLKDVRVRAFDPTGNKSGFAVLAA